MKGNNLIIPNAQSGNALDRIRLKDYDMVVAVTQIAVNQTMGEYLYAHPKDFAIYAVADDDADIVALTDDPSKANCYLKGTLQLEKVKGKYINLVKLKTEKGNQTVSYNITMQNGEFHINVPDLDYTKKQESDKPWIFEMFVNLSMQEVAKSDLPPDLKKKLQNVDENMFSIQQLYLDLNTAALNSIDGVKFPSMVKNAAFQILNLYLAQQQKTNKPLFGVSVKFKPKEVAPPTLTPTYVDFCVTPYHDAEGKNTNPDLDTLNYLVNTNHRQAPSYPPQSFNFNWVDDINIHGAMAVRHEPFTDFIVEQLSPILKTLCPKMHCEANGKKRPPNDVVIELKPGHNKKFNRVHDASTGKIAEFSYRTSDSDEDKGPIYNYYHFKVSGEYSMKCQLVLKNDAIQLSGSIIASANTFTQIPNPGGTPSRSETKMPKTTFNWSVDLQLYMDADKNGQLDMRMINRNFNTAPKVEAHDDSWWKKFLRGLSGYMKSYTIDLGNLRGATQDLLEGKIQENLTEVLKNTNHFVFPGAKTFAFKNPQFSNTKDLASNITYLNPND